MKRCLGQKIEHPSHFDIEWNANQEFQVEELQFDKQSLAVNPE